MFTVFVTSFSDMERRKSGVFLSVTIDNGNATTTTTTEKGKRRKPVRDINLMCLTHTAGNMHSLTRKVPLKIHVCTNI